MPVHAPELGPCWVWLGCKDDEGYGRLRVSRKKVEKTHRLAWSLENGEIGDGIKVLHRCDNRACVRPAHLFTGSQADNMRDMFAKGRACDQRGIRNNRTELTADNVETIRRLLSAGMRQVTIGRLFRIGESSVSHIKTGRTWAHV